MLGRIIRSENQEYAKRCVDADNHLEVIHTFAAMPLPQRFRDFFGTLLEDEDG